jgi:hypothetical protein
MCDDSLGRMIPTPESAMPQLDVNPFLGTLLRFGHSQILDNLVDGALVSHRGTHESGRSTHSISTIICSRKSIMQDHSRIVHG